MKPFNATVVPGFRKKCVSVRKEMHMHINEWEKLQTLTGIKHKINP
jgi:hypothetical protein